MNSFYWFHLLSLYLTPPRVELSLHPSQTLAPFPFGDPAGAGLAASFSTCMYAAAILEVCAQADFSPLLWNPGFLAAGFRNPSSFPLVYDSIFLTAGFCLIRWIVEEVRRRKR